MHVCDAGVEVVECREDCVSVVSKHVVERGNVVSAFDQSMCLESFEKDKVASATGGVEVVADKSNALCSMQFALGINSHDHLSVLHGLSAIVLRARGGML